MFVDYQIEGFIEMFHNVFIHFSDFTEMRGKHQAFLKIIFFYAKPTLKGVLGIKSTSKSVVEVYYFCFNYKTVWMNFCTFHMKVDWKPLRDCSLMNSVFLLRRKKITLSCASTAIKVMCRYIPCPLVNQLQKFTESLYS